MPRLRRWLGARGTAADTLSGRVTLDGTLTGTIDTSAASRGLGLAGRLNGQDLDVRGTQVSALGGDVRVDDALRRPFITASLDGDSIVIGKLVLRRAAGSFATDAPTVGGRSAGHFALRAVSDSGPELAIAGRTAMAPDTTRLTIDSARIGVGPGHAFRLVSPASALLAAPNGVAALDGLVLRDERGAQLSMSAALQDTGAVHASLAADLLSLGDLARLGGLVGGRGTTPFDGRLGARATVSGTRAAPLMDLRLATTDVHVAGVSVDSIGINGRYAARRLDGDLTIFRGGRSLLSANAALPLDLALQTVDDRQLPDSLRGALRADSLELALLGALVPGVQNVAGRVRATADLAGTWKHPLLFGALSLRGGAANVTTAGLRVQDLTADVALSGDSLRIDSVTVRSAGTAKLDGLVQITSPKNPTLDLRLAAHNFLAIDKPRVATLWLSTPTPVTVTGPYLGATVRGAVRADRGRIYIPELIEKELVDLSDVGSVVDTSSLEVRSLIPAPSQFVTNLTVEELSVGVGDDVWLRSPEANIKLGGSLAVTLAHSSLGGRSRDQLALRGALAVERGTYRLSLPPIAAPIFDVQPGTLRFFGTPDESPTLDIKAVHTVRQAAHTNRPDVRVQVAIAGTLKSPSLSLTSPDDPSISTTDLVSYLVAGEPAAVVLGQQGGASGAEQAVALGARLLSSYASGALSQGGPFDVVQFETVSSTETGTSSIFSSGRSILESTRLNVGGPLGEKTFYTFSTGLCGLGIGSQSNFALFRRGLGFRIEHRLTPVLSVSASFEPGSQNLCGSTQISSVLQTPPQGGFDFLRVWSF